MTDSSVAIPIVEPETAIPYRDIDCESFVRGGVTYYRQRVIISSLPEGATDTASDQLGMLGKIYKELVKMNLHLEVMTGEKFNGRDTGDS